MLWFLRGDGGAQPVAVSGSGARGPSDAGVELASSSQAGSSTELERDPARSGAFAVGVRLPGPAKLDGHVIDRATGAGVPNVRVELLPVPPAGAVFLGRMLRVTGMGEEMSHRVRPIATALTDSLGAFRFQGVRQGTWYVEARGDYCVPESVVRARVVASGAGGPLDVYVLPGGRVLGTVLLPDGKPARGAQVAFVSGPGNFFTTALSGDVRWIEVVTDENGRFTVAGVPPGSGYEVTATGAGFCISHALDVAVKAGADTNVVVQTRVGGTISGRVVSEVAEGEPVPLAGAHLGAVPRGLRNLRCVEEILEQTHAVTGADGTYVMRGVPPGEVDVLAIAWEHLPKVGARVAIADATPSEASEIRLAKGALVRGRVVDANGAPISGVTPKWNMVDWKNFQFDLSFAPLMLAAVKGLDLPKTDADGKFWAGPIAGKPDYSIDFTKPGLVDQEFKWNPERDGSEITVVMRRGSSVEGVVMDALRSEPVTSFTITGSDRVDMEGEAPGSKNPYTGGLLVEDQGGRFKLDAVVPGKATFTFSAPGYQSKTLGDIDVAEGQPTRGVIVKLTPGGTVRGKVVDAKGEPVPGAQVIAMDEGGGMGARDSRTERDRARERRRGGRNAGFNMLFGGDASATGNVFPPGMMAYAAGLGLLGDRVKSTNQKGEFELTGLQGKFKIAAFHRDHTAAQSEEVSVDESTNVDGVVITLPQGGGVKGIVRDRLKNPVPGEIVVAVSPASMGSNTVSAGAGLYQAHSDASGAYLIEHMAPGSYFLVATRGDEDLNPMSFFGNWNFDLVTITAGEMLTQDVIDSSAAACKVYGIITYKGQPIERGNLSAVTFDTDNLLGVEWKAARMLGDGKFEFAGLAPGEYQLNLDNNGPQVRMPLEVLDVPEMRVELRLPESGLAGTVIDENTKAPIAGSQVQLRSTEKVQASGMLGALISSEGRAVNQRSDEDGKFEFERLSPGEYLLVARPPSTPPKSADGASETRYAASEPVRVRIEENRTERDVVVALQAGLTLEGTVVDAQKSPVSGATVYVRQQGGATNAVEQAITGKLGRFKTTGLSPGLYRVTVTAQGFADGTLSDVKLERGTSKPADVEIVVQKGVHVIVRVFAPGGAPASGARGDLFPLQGDRTNDPASAGKAIQNLFSGEGASDESGRIDMGRYMPGEYRLEVQRGFSKAADPRVVLKAGEDEVELRIDLP